jgi:hypothetical protein
MDSSTTCVRNGSVGTAARGVKNMARSKRNWKKGPFDARDERRESTDDNRWDEKAGLQRDALSSQVIDALEARRQEDRR